MKCPNCGSWNRDSFDICQKCGSKLVKANDSSQPVWKAELKDSAAKSYISVDESGETDSSLDSRDALAQEMADLKIRKREGERKKLAMTRSRAQQMGETVTVPPVSSSEKAGESPVFSEIPQKTEKRYIPKGKAARVITSAPSSNTPVTDHDLGYNMEYTDTVKNDPVYDIARTTDMWQPKMRVQAVPEVKKAHIFSTAVKIMLITIIVVLTCLCGFFGYHYFSSIKNEKPSSSASVTASLVDDSAAHTILIPGDDGQQIYIKELHSSYVVAGGFATIEVADHLFYDNIADLPETMSVTLTPYVKTSGGRQKPLNVITYDINIPISPIELISPDAVRSEVSTAMYSMQFSVRPGSTVYVNDINVSDTVNSDDGIVTYNATVQPIGDNQFTIRVRSQYCRENYMSIVLYREKQEIPLDLYAGTYTTTTDSALEISATTLPGVIVDVLSPHTDLKITNLDVDGTFTFNAVFDHYGINTISISASDPQGKKKTSVVNYNMYYVPTIDDYSRKAWPLNRSSEYAELLSNTTVRAAKSQVYLVKGKVDRVVSTKPQMVVINCGENGTDQPVLIENATTSSSFATTIKEGVTYRIYADVYGTYEAMPWLVARYIYAEDDTTEE